MTNLSPLFTYTSAPMPTSEQISVVDAQAVQEMAKKYLVADRMVIIAVGDRARIAAGLEADLGSPAEIRDPDGLPVK